MWPVSILDMNLSMARLDGVKCHPQSLQDPTAIGSILTVKHSGYFKNGTLRNGRNNRTSEPKFPNGSLCGCIDIVWLILVIRTELAYCIQS